MNTNFRRLIMCAMAVSTVIFVFPFHELPSGERERINHVHSA